jgi:hypothetical protein
MDKLILEEVLHLILEIQSDIKEFKKELEIKINK